MECQDTSLPVATQTSLNYTISPMLEVFTETRPRVEFREKRDTFILENQNQDPVSAKESVFSRKLRSLLQCGSTNCHKGMIFHFFPVFLWFCFFLVNATFNNISVISLWSVLFGGENFLDFRETLDGKNKPRWNMNSCWWWLMVYGV